MDDVAKELQYVGAQMEQILSEVRAIHELVANVPTRGEFNNLREDVTELKQDVKTIKVAMGDLSDDVAELRYQSGYARPGHISKRTA